jgi:hypothetical protein
VYVVNGKRLQSWHKLIFLAEILVLLVLWHAQQKYLVPSQCQTLTQCLSRLQKQYIVTFQRCRGQKSSKKVDFAKKLKTSLQRFTFGVCVEWLQNTRCGNHFKCVFCVFLDRFRISLVTVFDYFIVFIVQVSFFLLFLSLPPSTLVPCGSEQRCRTNNSNEPKTLFEINMYS